MLQRFIACSCSVSKQLALITRYGKLLTQTLERLDRQTFRVERARRKALVESGEDRKEPTKAELKDALSSALAVAHAVSSLV